MKKELKWTFEIVEIQLMNYPIYAPPCNLAFGNCYFTRPLYDESADTEVLSNQVETDAGKK